MTYALKMVEGSRAICARKNDKLDIATLYLDQEVLDAKRKRENRKLKHIVKKQIKLDKLVKKFNKYSAEDGAGARSRQPPVEAFLVEYQKQRNVTRSEIKAMRKTLKGDETLP